LDRRAFHGDPSRRLVDVGFHGDVAANVGEPSDPLVHQFSNLDKEAVDQSSAPDDLADDAAKRKAEFGVIPVP